MVTLRAHLLKNFYSLKFTTVDSIVDRVLAVNVNVVHVQSVFNQNSNQLQMAYLGCVEQRSLLQVVFLSEVDAQGHKKLQHVYAFFFVDALDCGKSKVLVELIHVRDVSYFNLVSH